MSHYLLSVHSVEGEAREAPDPEVMRAFMERVVALEAELDATGAWVFGGRLHEPAATTVVRSDEGDVVMTDGPFAEAKEHIAGFYIVEAADLDDALAWAAKVSNAIGNAIEVRPFVATGRVVDQMPAGEG